MPLVYALQEATQQDIPEVMDVASAALTERYDPNFLAQLVEHGTFLVVRTLTDDRLVGFAVATRTNMVEARLLIIGLMPELQGKGVGGRLLREIEMRMRRTGALTLILEVREDNTRAIGFYRRKGYDLVGRMPRYYQDGSQALLMRKGL